MTHRMSAHLGLFPATHGLAGGLKPCGLAEIPEQPVRFQLMQILLSSEHRIPERPVQQAHVTQIERHSLQFNSLSSARPYGGMNTHTAKTQKKCR